MIDDLDLSVLAEERAREALLFRRIYPPRHDGGGPSYFGGEPCLPRGVDWPRDSAGEGMSFFGQIDCAEFPACAERHLLPDRGLLYFFGNTEFGERVEQGRVIYYDGEAADLTPVPPPAHVKPCFGGYWTYTFPWLEHRPEAAPRSFPKWSVEPLVAQTYPSQTVLEMEEAPEGLDEACESLQRESLTAAFGPAPARHHPKAPYREIWVPDEAFPYTWLHVEIFAGVLARELARVAGQKTASGKAVKVFGTARSQCLEWYRRGQEAGSFGPVGAKDREAFFVWCRSLAEMAVAAARPGLLSRLTGSAEPGATKEFSALEPFYLNDAMKQAYQLATPLCLVESAATASLIPDQVAKTLAYQDVHSHGSVRHQMLGHADAPQYAAWTHKDDVLLMQFHDDPGLFWSFESGVVQFWIKPEDLAARDFDQVVMTMECT